MTCDEAIQLLPWLLNGTLEEGERREVRRHLETCEACRQALGETREAWRVFGQHLPSETLVALAYGEVPSGIDPALAERHLASCPECAAELELARTSRRLEEDDKIAPFPVRPAPKARTESRSWRAAALAASLAGVVAASGWIHSARELRSVSERAAERPPAPVVEPAPAVPSGGEGTLQRQLDETDARLRQLEESEKDLRKELEEKDLQLAQAARPQANPKWVTLDGVERGENDQEEAVRSDRYVILAFDSKGSATPRRIEVWSSTGKISEVPGLLPDEIDQYSIGFPAGFFPKPGRYTIRLFEDGKQTPIETYTILVK